jgi:hypothetical protein
MTVYETHTNLCTKKPAVRGDRQKFYTKGGPGLSIALFFKQSRRFDDVRAYFIFLLLHGVAPIRPQTQHLLTLPHG